MTTMARELGFGTFDAISRKSFIAMVTLLVVSAGITVRADTRFAVVGILNNTEKTIRVHYKWEGEEWRIYTLLPKGRVVFPLGYTRSRTRTADRGSK